MSVSETAAVPKPQSLALPRSLALALAVSGALLLNFLFADGHDRQRCVELALLGVFALIAARDAVRGRLPGLSPMAGQLLFAFAGLGLASSFSAWSLRHAIYEWSSMVLLLMLALALGRELGRAGKRGILLVLQVTGAVCALYSLRVLVAYGAALAAGLQLDMHALAVGFSNMRFLNHAQTALLPFIILLCLEAPAGSRMRRGWFALAAFWWALLFVGEARATMLAMAAGCLLAFILRRTHARAFVRTMLYSALAGLLLYALLFIGLPMLAGLQPMGVPSSVVVRSVADPSSGRNFLWTRALHLIAEHPLLGVGPQHFAHDARDVAFGAHPHDWLLQIGVEWGLPALACLLGAILLGARGLLRAGQQIAASDLQGQQMLAALIVACAGIVVDGLFSGVLVMPQSRLAIALAVGCAAGWTAALRPQDRADTAPAGVRGIVAVLALGALCGLLWSIGPDVASHARGESTAQEAGNQTHWPRMWEDGYF